MGDWAWTTPTAGAEGRATTPGAATSTAVVAGTVALVTIALGVLGLAATPPAVGWLPAVVIALLALAPATVVLLSSSLRATFAIRGRTLAAALCVAAVVLVTVWSTSVVGFLVVLLVVPVALVVVVVALVGLWGRGRADAVGALAVMALFVLAVTALLGAGTDDHAYTRWRMQLAADRYRDAGDRLLADPPDDPEPLDPDGFVVELDTTARLPDDGARGVAWPVVQGVPARTTGIVYDPERVMDPSEEDVIAGGVYGCDHLDGPFWWCRLD